MNLEIILIIFLSKAFFINGYPIINKNNYTTKCRISELNRFIKCSSHNYEVHCDASLKLPDQLNSSKKFLIGKQLKSAYYTTIVKYFIYPKSRTMNLSQDSILDLYHSESNQENFGIRVHDQLCFNRLAKLLDQSSEIKKEKYSNFMNYFDVRLIGILMVDLIEKNKPRTQSYILNSLIQGVQKYKKSHDTFLKQNKNQQDSDSSESSDSSDSESDSSDDEQSN
ncbi:unnamed protein product [Brachionus calyciflorus]|uniref:Uncharacterized protein n=1 Tax=Brachionus calyciflorus TaxID=104777 RepID=A0A814M3F7_9BILA|nr:unnamed protein product [Brachionus calyciflorus]